MQQKEVIIVAVILGVAFLFLRGSLTGFQTAETYSLYTGRPEEVRFDYLTGREYIERSFATYSSRYDGAIIACQRDMLNWLVEDSTYQRSFKLEVMQSCGGVCETNNLCIVDGTARKYLA